jgi:hypothetical protein
MADYINMTTLYGNDDFTICQLIKVPNQPKILQPPLLHPLLMSLRPANWKDIASTGGKLVKCTRRPGGKRQRKSFYCCFNNLAILQANWLLIVDRCLLSSLPYELFTGVSYDTYVEHTDKYNIHGWWEWENGTVRVIELPSKFRERCVGAIVRQISSATGGVISTNVDILYDGSTSECC